MSRSRPRPPRSRATPEPSAAPSAAPASTPSTAAPAKPKAPLPDPVIFLPGIMGSTLRDEYALSPENVWSVLKAATKNYDRITLHPDDLRYELREPARVVKDEVFGLFYGEIIEELRYNLSPTPEEAVPVYPFAYDWRQPLAVLQKELETFIEEVVARTSLQRHYHAQGYTPATGKVNLVAHSMGGLIVAGYIRTRGFERVHKVATLASPLRGSLEAVAKTTIGVGGFSLGSGASREREAARVTPALYHLLPSYAGAIEAKGGLSADIFLPEAWQPGILQTLRLFIERNGLTPDRAEAQATELLAHMLDTAWKHRTRIEGLKLDDPKRWLCIVGVDTKTRVRLVSRPDANGRPFFELEDPVNDYCGDDKLRTGDGTVPYLGARSAFIPVEQLVCVTPDDFGFFEFKDKTIAHLGFHGAIPNMNFVQQCVLAHLTDRPMRKPGGHPSPEIAPAAWDPPIPGLKG